MKKIFQHLPSVALLILMGAGCTGPISQTAPALTPGGQFVLSQGKDGNWDIATPDKTTVGTITKKVDEYFDLTQLKRTSRYVYIAGKQSERGGVLDYDPAVFWLYRLDLKDNHIEDLSIPDQAEKGYFNNFMDMSSDESLFAWATDRQIGIKNAQAAVVKKFPVWHDTRTFGDGHFSPDGTKLTYAASEGGDLDTEKGAVVVIDLGTGHQTVIDASKAGECGRFSVNGWKADGTVDYGGGHNACPKH